MADSYHIINGQVVPFSGGRKCNDTDAWRDATPLELQLQEQLAESENAIAAQAAEIEALRAEVDGWKAQHSRDSAELRRLCQHRDEYKARAERLAEALALLPDEIVMIEHNPDEGPLMFCCGRKVTLSWRHDLIPTHDEECWYARMRALRDHDQENRND